MYPASAGICAKTIIGKRGNKTCDTLIDDGLLDSFAILSIVSELLDEFDIAITPADIIPENFNSATALWEMVCRLKD